MASIAPPLPGKFPMPKDGHHRAGSGRQCGLHGRALAAVCGDGLGPGVGAGQRDNPTVGLLNIGEEIIKGNEIIKKAGELLRSASKAGDLNFYGNVEGNDIFKGTADIVVCDGFVGNVALKASEGLAAMIVNFLKVEFSRSIFTKMAAIAAYPILSALKKQNGPPSLQRRCIVGVAWPGVQEPWLGGCTGVWVRADARV